MRRQSMLRTNLFVLSVLGGAVRSLTTPPPSPSLIPPPEGATTDSPSISASTSLTKLFLPFPPDVPEPTGSLSADIVGVDSASGQTTWAIHAAEAGAFTGTATLIQGTSYASFAHPAFVAECTYTIGRHEPAAICSGFLLPAAPAAPTPSFTPLPGEVPTEFPNEPGTLSLPGGGQTFSILPIEPTTWTEPASSTPVEGGTTAPGVTALPTSTRTLTNSGNTTGSATIQPVPGSSQSQSQSQSQSSGVNGTSGGAQGGQDSGAVERHAGLGAVAGVVVAAVAVGLGAVF